MEQEHMGNSDTLDKLETAIKRLNLIEEEIIKAKEKLSNAYRMLTSKKSMLATSEELNIRQMEIISEFFFFYSSFPLPKKEEELNIRQMEFISVSENIAEKANIKKTDEKYEKKEEKKIIWQDPDLRPEEVLTMGRRRRTAENVSQLPEGPNRIIRTLAEQNPVQERFQYWYKFVCEHTIISDEHGEWFFSSEAGDFSRAALLEGSPPYIASSLFDNGLLMILYPGKDLKELEQFPDSIKNAAASYQTVVGNHNIFLRFISVIPEDDPHTGTRHLSQHFIKMGRASGRYTKPTFCSVREFPIAEVSDREWISKRRALDYVTMKSQIEVTIKGKQNIWLNDMTSRVCIVSNSGKATSAITSVRLKELWAHINNNDIDGTEKTKAKLCDLLQEKDDHECNYCHTAYNHDTETSRRIENVLDDVGLPNLDNAMET